MRNRHLNKIVICIAGLLFFACDVLPPARAEGSKAGQWTGAWGVNRVIRTPEGYYAVSAVADIEFFMPADTDPTTGVKTVTKETDPFGNTPSAYLGGSGVFVGTGGGRAEVDAGFQFETQVWRTNVAKGWSAILSNGSSTKMPTPSPEHFTFIRVWDDSPNVKKWIPWRAPATTWSTDGSTGKLSSRIQYEITGNRQVADGVFDAQGAAGADANGNLNIRQANISGEAKLVLPAFGRTNATGQVTDALNTCYWNQGAQFETPDKRFATDARFGYRVSPWIGQQIFDASQNDKARVKRAVAMTRIEPYLSGLDGSYLTCTYTSGKVAHVGEGLADWQYTSVDQTVTGYDTAGDDIIFPWMAYDRRWPWANSVAASDHLWTMYSRTLVEFSNASAIPNATVAFDQTYNRNARAESTDGRDQSRYVRETVRINLRTVTRPSGSPVEVE